MAIVVFEDLECPQCARVEPLLEDAVKNYKIPLGALRFFTAPASMVV